MSDKFDNAYKIELSKEDFLEQLNNSWSNFQKKRVYTTKAIARFAVENNLVKVGFNTISSKSKKELREIILKAQEPQAEAPKARNVTNGSDSMAKELIESLDELKNELQGTSLNPFLKSKAIGAVENLLDKIEDEEKLKNIGLAGNISIIAITVVDGLIGIKTIIAKVKAIKSKRDLKDTKKADNAVK